MWFSPLSPGKLWSWSSDYNLKAEISFPKKIKALLCGMATKYVSKNARNAISTVKRSNYSWPHFQKVNYCQPPLECVCVCVYMCIDPVLLLQRQGCSVRYRPQACAGRTSRHSWPLLPSPPLSPVAMATSSSQGTVHQLPHHLMKPPPPPTLPLLLTASHLPTSILALDHSPNPLCVTTDMCFCSLLHLSCGHVIIMIPFVTWLCHVIWTLFQIHFGKVILEMR